MAPEVLSSAKSVPAEVGIVEDRMVNKARATLQTNRIILASAICVLGLLQPDMGFPQTRPDFEVLFSGDGDIASFIYFKQDSKYFIDTDLNVGVETIRYKRFYLLVELLEETYMGRKYNSNMVFDPTRARWSFGPAGRLELGNYFFEARIHHDCFHDIDRNGESIYWNSPRIGFGTLGYLPKYKYRQPQAGGEGVVWKHKLDYHLSANFFAPLGAVWQKNHDYDFSADANLRFQVARYKRLGFDIESNNLLVLNKSHDLKHQHGLNFNFTIYGNRAAMIAYIAWWPYDNQSIRNMDGRKVFGIHFGF